MGGNNAEAQPALVYQHSNGETYTADNIESAMSKCTGLAGLTLKEAGLLVELVAMGNQKLDEVKETAVNKAESEVVTKPEKITKEPQKTESETDNPKHKSVELTETEKYIHDVPIAQIESSKSDELVRQDASLEKLKRAAERSTILPKLIELFEVAETTDTTVWESLSAHAAAASTQLQESPLSETAHMQPEVIETPRPVTAVEPESIAVTNIEEPIYLEVALPAIESATVSEAAVRVDVQEDEAQPEPVQLHEKESREPEFVSTKDIEILEPEAVRLEEESIDFELDPLTAEIDLPSNEDEYIGPDTSMAEEEVDYSATSELLEEEEAQAQEIIGLTSMNQAELPQVAEQVFQEEVIENIAQTLTALEPEAATIPHELLSVAIEHIQQHQHIEENSPATAPSEAKIIETFTELFENIGLEYTKEEVEQFVSYILTKKIGERSVENGEDEFINSSSDSGTHERLLYLLGGNKPLKKLKQSMHSALGRLVLLDIRKIARSKSESNRAKTVLSEREISVDTSKEEKLFAAEVIRYGSAGSLRMSSTATASFQKIREALAAA